MEKILKRVYSSRPLSLFLRIFSHFVTVFSAVVFLLCFLFFLKESRAAALSYLAILGFPFLLVSLLRRLLDAKRPYQVYDFYQNPPKNKDGSSFPSRHAFSAFAIGTVCIFAYPVLGSALLLAGAGMCVCRVLLGVHFIRDVVAGAACGISCSLIGTLILLF